MKRVTAEFLIIFAIAAASYAGGLDDETAVTHAALDSYYNLVHGGTAVAFPEERRPVRLHRSTISPSRAQLRVRVSSPANRAAAEQYSGRSLNGVIERLQRQSVRARGLADAPSGYTLAEAQRTACGPQYDPARFVDAVAVSRPAFDGRNNALLYLEFSGGARAYHARRIAGRWHIDWFVELWACG